MVSFGSENPEERDLSEISALFILPGSAGPLLVTLCWCGQLSSAVCSCHHSAWVKHIEPNNHIALLNHESNGSFLPLPPLFIILVSVVQKQLYL